MYAPAGQEEAQVQQAQELAAGDSYDYGNDQTPSGNDVSNPYLGVASDPTIAALAGASAFQNANNLSQYGQRYGAPSLINFSDYNALRGTTLADPFRDDPAGIKSMINFDYRNQRDTYDDLQRQYAQFMNPYGIGSRGNTGILNSLDEETRKALAADLQRMDKNPFDSGDKKKGDLRSGLQREYGSIFGSNVGLPTFQGNVVDQDRQFGTGEMFARGLASLAPGPIGTILSQVGKTKPTLDTSPTYDPAKDPNSPEYEGPGYFGNLTNVLTGGAGTQIGDKISSEFNALIDGIDFLNKPTNDKDLSSMTDPNYKGSAPVSIVREDLTAPSINYSPKPMGAGENLGEAFNTGIANINPEVTDNVKNNMVSDIPLSIESRVNASSQKTRDELDAIEGNTKEMTLDETMKKFNDEIAGYKKEGLDFRNLTAKDRENMTLEELIELRNRMNDLGTLSR